LGTGLGAAKTVVKKTKRWSAMTAADRLMVLFLIGVAGAVALVLVFVLLIPD